MMVFNEAGYTPNNFQSLVLNSGLTNPDFMALFNIKRATFYCYKNGKFNPHWQYWIDLVRAVENHNLSRELNIARLC